MSITLDSLTAWIYRLRATRMAGTPRTETRTNTGDDVTRVRESFYDERGLLCHGRDKTHLETAHETRDALRKHMTAL